MSRGPVTAPTADRVRAVLNGIVDPCSAAAGAPAGLDDMRPWIDTAHFEIPGRQALRWALSLLAGLNHVTLALRRPFPGEGTRGVSAGPSA